jgi:predicted membrane-bound spermidine synthase
MVSMSQSEQEVVIRRSPRFLRFFILGIIVGIIGAMSLTFAFPANAQFTQMQIFGFLTLICGIVGGTLGLVVALILDRIWSNRTITTIAEHDVEGNPSE